MYKYLYDVKAWISNKFELSDEATGAMLLKKSKHGNDVDIGNSY